MLVRHDLLLNSLHGPELMESGVWIIVFFTSLGGAVKPLSLFYLSGFKWNVLRAQSLCCIFVFALKVAVDGP